MFSPDIVCSDEFLGMPPTSRDLYVQLAIRADDDGFVQPKSIMRLLGSVEDDLKILVAKRFLLPFESGVVVIKHWLIHNMIRLDRYKPTRFLEEKKMLKIKENRSYTDKADVDWQPNGNQMVPQVRLGKVRLGKEREEIAPDKPERHLDYLLGIPQLDIVELEKKYNVYEQGIRGKADDLHNYILAKGKTHTYKNYKALLMNALKKDFGIRKPEDVEKLERIREHQKASTVSSPFAKTLANKMKM